MGGEMGERGQSSRAGWEERNERDIMSENDCVREKVSLLVIHLHIKAQENYYELYSDSNMKWIRLSVTRFKTACLVSEGLWVLEVYLQTPQG